MAGTGVIVDQSFTLREQGIPRFFAPCDLDLDPMTFIYEIDLHLLKMYSRTKKRSFYVEAFESYRITDRQTYRQTDATEITCITTPLRVWQ